MCNIDREIKFKQSPVKMPLHLKALHNIPYFVPPPNSEKLYSYIPNTQSHCPAAILQLSNHPINKIKQQL